MHPISFDAPLRALSIGPRCTVGGLAAAEKIELEDRPPSSKAETTVGPLNFCKKSTIKVLVVGSHSGVSGWWALRGVMVAGVVVVISELPAVVPVGLVGFVFLCGRHRGNFLQVISLGSWELGQKCDS